MSAQGSSEPHATMADASKPDAAVDELLDKGNQLLARLQEVSEAAKHNKEDLQVFSEHAASQFQMVQQAANNAAPSERQYLQWQLRKITGILEDAVLAAVQLSKRGMLEKVFAQKRQAKQSELFDITSQLQQCRCAFVSSLRE
ncbi:hypothetical protein BKA62DRAFT_831863 [Auriculariales sp. MPI-PUGE-AT-0066]|nr:hypothetical protein BKA62DRAFT_831863 [Auriculariales sp. MPI-PUGE-AT-0066]